MLNSSTVCIDINNGTLEREVVVGLNTVDITTEGKSLVTVTLGTCLRGTVVVLSATVHLSFCYHASVYLRPGSDCPARVQLMTTYRSCLQSINTCTVMS